ncbi:hypothetical protein ABZP36_021169 [Zizania latifolia]
MCSSFAGCAYRLAALTRLLPPRPAIASFFFSVLSTASSALALSPVREEGGGAGAGEGGRGVAMDDLLMHGTLEATIFEAANITGDAPGPFGKFIECLKTILNIGPGATRLYATIDLGWARVGRTRVIDDKTVNPRWNEKFHIYCAHYAANVVFSVKVALPIGALLIGQAYLPVKELLSSEPVERWLDILGEDKQKLPHEPTIHVRLQFRDVAADGKGWGGGVGDVEYPGVPCTYFDQHPGCRVTLYQDAHVPDTIAPTIALAGGEHYQPGRCWEDVFDAISNAQHLIYITGWSVYTGITLIRDGTRQRPGGDATLGELLKRKASEGVRVLLLVWDDRTSVESFRMKTGSCKRTTP